MKNWLGLMAVGLTLAIIVSLARMHWHKAASALPATPVTNADANDEAKEAQNMVTITGPLADYMARHRDGHVDTLTPVTFTSRDPNPADHVGDSPVGTSAQLLHKTFAVTDIVDLPFQIPAHAVNPKMHGTYRSFLQRNQLQPTSAEEDDDAANVECLVLSEKQFSDMLQGHPVDPLFSGDEAHFQEVNLSIPPTWSQSAKYYLVFHNNQRGKGKKVVQADFDLDF